MSTVNLTVGASSDDAHSLRDGTSYSHTAVACKSDSGGYNSTAWCSGVRFTNVPIARSDDIVSATLSVYVHSDLKDDPRLTITAEGGNAATFSSGSKPVDRTPSAYSVSWNATGVGTGYKSPPAVAAIVESATDNVGWSSGSALALILKGDIAVTKAFRYRSYDNGVSGMYAKLDIDYTSGGPLPVIMDHYKRLRT